MKILIVGAGQVGFHLGKMLSAENHDVIVIDSNAEACRRAAELLDVLVLEGHGASPSMLMKAGIKECDMLVAVSAVDEVNIMACLIASTTGVPLKIARLRNSEYSAPDSMIKALDLGIDIIIHPEEETARELVWLFRRAAATDVLEFANGAVQVIGMRLDADAPILNKTLQEIDEAHPDILFRLVAIFRANRTIIPTGADVVTKGDQLFFISKTDQVPKILALAGKSEEKMQNLMILGGGKVGRLVAAELEKDKEIKLKLIESSREKSALIAGQLRRTLIIRGDGTDLDLLATEGIIDMDVYMAVTDDEETNIISCLMAKHLGVRRTLTLINRSDYLPIMSSIGLDAAVDKQMITANTILRFIRRGNIVSYASLRGIDAEILEIKVSSGSKIAGQTLKDIKLPQDVLIGMITRGRDVMVPVGESVILPDDQLIVFALPKAISSVEKLFS